MSLLTLSWKNLTSKPWSLLLSTVLFALGVGLISLLFLLEKQLQEKFESNLAGIDLVIGAKGSPLQMILSSMYHIDAPTGNIALQEVRPFLNPGHPLIEAAIPLALGDSYRTYRIVGTTHDILDMYGVEIGQGEIWARDLEATIGAAVAEELGMKIGDTFASSHGFLDDEQFAHDHDFKVVGILAPSGTVLDQLILTTVQSFWHVHGHADESAAPTNDASDEDHAEDDHDHGDEDHDHIADDHSHDEGDHDGHDHAAEVDPHAGHDHGPIVPLLEEDPEEEITSLLIKFKARNYQALNMQRSINENTDLQAATPAIEINRLFSLMDAGEQALRLLAVVIMFVSGLSIFISLYSSLKERKYELALMRVSGASPGKLFLMIVLEGLLLAMIGYIIGIALSHIGMELVGGIMKSSYRYSFSGFEFLQKELYLLAGALAIGFLAAVLPAVQASRTDIAETLTEGR
ncbi:MAG: FtsX-like permease family protein [Saprospiraceae bacterium]|nr:FtsX-like permease family protein [Saprospiraceae bacterium]